MIFKPTLRQLLLFLQLQRMHIVFAYNFTCYMAESVTAGLLSSKRERTDEDVFLLGMPMLPVDMIVVCFSSCCNVFFFFLQLIVPTQHQAPFSFYSVMLV